MSKLNLFCFLILFFSWNAQGAGEGEAVSTAELSSKIIDASLELESGNEWRSEEIRAFTNEATLILGWMPIADWRLGFEGTAVIAREEDGGGLGDSELTITRKKLFQGAFGAFHVGSLTLLPTQLYERRGGMMLAQGAHLAWELEPISGLSIGYEAKGARFFRDRERMEILSQEASAAWLDKYRLEQEANLAYELFRNFSLEACVIHTSGWKWFGGRDAVLELEQKFAYAVGSWTLGLGHRQETLLLDVNGERKNLALFRAAESKVFGTLEWAL